MSVLKVQVWSHTLDDFDPSVYVWEDDGSDRFKTENQLERAVSDGLKLSIKTENQLERAVRWAEALYKVLSDDQVILFNGTDENGHLYDAMEWTPGRVVECSCCLSDDDDLWRSEARQMAGMAHGNRGLADFDGLELDGPDCSDDDEYLWSYR